MIRFLYRDVWHSRRALSGSGLSALKLPSCAAKRSPLISTFPYEINIAPLLAARTKNAEILTLTYGGIVRQLVADFENVGEVNKQLKKMGHNMGQRMIDEYLSVTKTQTCSDFRETAEKIATVGLKLFLNTTASVTDWSPDGTSCSLVLDSNPLSDFVQLPEELQSLKYNNIICGVIEGALEMVNIQVECDCVRDIVQGDQATELRLQLIESRSEQYPFKDDD